MLVGILMVALMAYDDGWWCTKPLDLSSICHSYYRCDPNNIHKLIDEIQQNPYYMHTYINIHVYKHVHYLLNHLNLKPFQTSTLEITYWIYLQADPHRVQCKPLEESPLKLLTRREDWWSVWSMIKLLAFHHKHQELKRQLIYTSLTQTNFHGLLYSFSAECKNQLWLVTIDIYFKKIFF